MNVIEFDGTKVTYEAYAPPLTVQEVTDLHRARVRDMIRDFGFDPDEHTAGEVQYLVSDAKAFRDACHKLSELECEDHRERIGLDRKTGRPYFTRVRRLDLDKVADMLGVRTSEPGWETATLEALKAAPPLGVVPGQSTTDLPVVEDELED